MRSHGLADFVMAVGEVEIDVYAEAGASPGRIEEVFDHLVKTGIDQLAGTPAVHASAVTTPAGAIALVGGSGAGKSTLAALLSQRWALLADDYLPLTVTPEAVLAHPSSSWVRLRRPSAEHVGESGTVRAGKLAVERPSETEPRPLARIYAIGEEAADISIVACSRREAFVHVASQLHRLDPKSPALLAAELGFIEAITARVPVRALRYPRRFDVAGEVAAAIERDLSPAGSP